MAETLTPRAAEHVALLDRVHADNVSATNLLTEEIAKAQVAMRDAYDLLQLVSVGGDDGDLSPEDHTDAVHELIAARRALRHLARIIDGHAYYLESLDQPAEVRA